MDTLKKLFSLEGYHIVVTGASSGLGLNQAIMLANCGATVHALSRSGKVKVDIEEKIPESVNFYSMDVNDEKSITETFTEIGNKTGIDVLVNNAGINLRKPATEVTSEEWDQIHNTNSKGVFLSCKHAYPYLKKSKHTGRIINISSMASYLGFSEILPYVSSKSSVIGITRGLATDWRNDNILVNSISPGWFPSELNVKVWDDERKQKILNKIPLQRFGKPEELSAMVCFLASPAATYINGQDFSVDGGALAFGY